MQPKMQSIHDGRYLAEYGVTARGPLLVVTKPQGGGAYIEGENATQWADAIRTAADKSEANALCKSILDSGGNTP